MAHDFALGGQSKYCDLARYLQVKAVSFGFEEPTENDKKEIMERVEGTDIPLVYFLTVLNSFNAQDVRGNYQSFIENPLEFEFKQ